jgi:hypothetical protein
LLDEVKDPHKFYSEAMFKLSFDALKELKPVASNSRAYKDNSVKTQSRKLQPVKLDEFDLLQERLKERNLLSGPELLLENKLNTYLEDMQFSYRQVLSKN